MNKEIYYNIINNRYIDNNDNVKRISSEINTDIFNKIKNIIYLSSKYERETYCSELYNELKKINPKNYYSVIEKCNPYKAYLSFKNDVSFINDGKNKNEVKFILNLYHINYNSFLRKTKKALDLFLKKIYCAVYLFNKEQEENAEI